MAKKSKADSAGQVMRLGSTGGWPPLKHPPTTPVPDIWIKLDRAYQHVRELETIIEPIESDPKRTLLNPDSEAFQQFKAEVGLAVDPKIGVIAGEVFYQLRSSLDHLVCRFIEFEKNTPSGKSQFPIFEDDVSKDPNRAGLYDRYVRGIGRSEVLAFIKSKQPYHRGHHASGHYLAVLNRKCNLDKHTALDIQVTRAERYDTMLGGIATFQAASPDYGAEPPVAFFNGRPVKVDTRFTVLVVFKEWAKQLGGRGDVVGSLYSMIGLIAKDITEGQAYL